MSLRYLNTHPVLLIPTSDADPLGVALGPPVTRRPRPHPSGHLFLPRCALLPPGTVHGRPGLPSSACWPVSSPWAAVFPASPSGGCVLLCSKSFKNVDSTWKTNHYFTIKSGLKPAHCCQKLGAYCRVRKPAVEGWLGPGEERGVLAPSLHVQCKAAG